jgi:hypothetical protein
MIFFSLRNLFKSAAPEQKIKTFQITDSIVKYFIRRYEALIPWAGYEVTVKDPENPEGEPKILEIKIKPENKEEDINKYIKRILLPQLYRKVDVEKRSDDKNYFFKEFDMDRYAKYIKDQAAQGNIINNPDFERAYAVYKEDAVAGEQQFVDHINRIKKAGFDTWLSYMKDHPEFDKHPCFVFALLDKIFSSSTKKTFNPVPASNPAVIGNMFVMLRDANFEAEDPVTDKEKAAKIKSLAFPKDVKAEPKNYQEIADEVGESPEKVKAQIHKMLLQSNAFGDLYKLMLKDHFLNAAKLREGAAKDETAIWRHFPRKDKLQPEVDKDGKQLTAQQVFDRNLDECTALSTPQNWCTTRSWNGIPYLTAGDFYIYINNGVAEVGIRFEGENIAEIAGPQTGGDRSCPRKNWREVIRFITENGWEKNITGVYAKMHWQEILKERDLNKDFFKEDGSINETEVDEYIKLIISQPRMYNRLDIGLFHAFPEVIQSFQKACIEGWGVEIANLQNYEAYKALERLQTDLYPEMPEFVQKDPFLVEAIHGRLAKGYEKNAPYLQFVMEKAPNHWEVYPKGKEIFKNAVLTALSSGIFWKARAIGISKKTKEEKEDIKKSNEAYNGIIKVISDYAPDLLTDIEFQAAMEAAKNESMSAALQDGFVAREMPENIMEDFLHDAANYEAIKNKIVNNITSAPDRAKSDASRLQSLDKVFTEKFIMSYINALAPNKMRKQQNFQKLSQDIIHSVLMFYILKYPLFEEKFKEQQDFYEAYKAKILTLDIPRLITQFKGKPEFNKIFDEKLLNDPEFKRRLDMLQENVDINKYKALLLNNTGMFLNFPKHLQENDAIQNAYILYRAKANANKRRVILREWKMLPESLRQKPEAIDGYVAAAIESIERAQPNDEYYLMSDGSANKKGVALDMVFLQDPRIVAAFASRDQRNNKKASVGWYNKVICAI